MSGISSPVHSPVGESVHSPMGGGSGLSLPSGYTYLTFNGQTIKFNGQPIVVKKVTP